MKLSRAPGGKGVTRLCTRGAGSCALPTFAARPAACLAAAARLLLGPAPAAPSLSDSEDTDSLSSVSLDADLLRRFGFGFSCFEDLIDARLRGLLVFKACPSSPSCTNNSCWHCGRGKTCRQQE